MKFLIILALFALVGIALYQKWQRIPPQTKQLWAMLFGLGRTVRQVQKQAQQSRQSPQQATQTSHSTSSSASSSTIMRPCAQCGLHVPESEGVMVAGAFYCCREHAR